MAAMAGPIEFSIEEIRALTEDFSHYIAEGKYGMVFRGRVQEPNPRNLLARDVVVKRSKDRREDLDMWQRERGFLEECSHPNVIQLIGFTDDEQDYYLVFPFYPNGTLQERISVLDWPTTLKILKGIGSGLHHIHTRRNPPVIHADLKPDNILVDEEYNPIICDFGSVIEEGEPHESGTIGYTDPVTLGEVSLETDIYSLGVIMLQMITKRNYVVTEEGNITTLVEAGRLLVHPILEHSGCNKRAREKITKLAMQCTNRWIGKRPSAEDVVDTLGDVGTKQSIWGKIFDVVKCKTN